MKTLKFKGNLVPKILDKSKTTTWRLFDDKNLQDDDLLILVNSDTCAKFAAAKITTVREKKLSEINETDFEEGHERYQNPKDMLENYRNYYGEQVNMNSKIKIVKFRVLEIF
ncbi:MAG: ASCH domain-containing protein [Patescibacteria group bacterium]